PSKYRFTAWIFSFEENLAIKNAPPIVRLCLTIGVHFKKGYGFLYREIRDQRNDEVLSLLYE
ncbi:hypothetical protein PDN49_21260, partial [Bacillus cereus]|nr:hypothetical protein [Bacillus cereus]MDA2335114.1 hypothetical protein [Bacillus cereus]MDA2357300.1 hypothetical protein [Bacillus cereus]